ncbi:hypothetical protein [Methylobacterium sp. 13MFTsu3.1M2]|uniref:DUF6894 family protein n=1 Tax=Methylobacterium sp. 13MFTsu3.1M2 TaxID=1502776 RepID=UPI000A7E3551|nr:hypothetical protein [Methylobacterium sp. 13MFTsu3.1M2]
MSRLFFDFHDGQSFLRDPIGFECSDREMIRNEAVRALSLMAKEIIPDKGETQAFTVVVRNAANATVYTATVSFAGLWLGELPFPPGEQDPFD